MANRSTRTKIKWQAKKAKDSFISMMLHLQNIDMLGKDNSKYIIDGLPPLISLLIETEKFIYSFLAGL